MLAVNDKPSLEKAIEKYHELNARNPNVHKIFVFSKMDVKDVGGWDNPKKFIQHDEALKEI